MDQGPQQTPWPAEPTGDPEYGVGADVVVAVLDEYDGVGLVPRQAGRLDQGSADRALTGCKPVPGVGVVTDDEVDGCIAQVAHAVEDDDGLGHGYRRYRHRCVRGDRAARRASTTVGVVISRPLSDAIDRLCDVFPIPSGLLRDLPADAVFARAATGELRESLARLLELVALDELGDRHAFEAFDLLAAERWQEMGSAEVGAISRFADAWWVSSLADHPGPPRPADRLGELCHLELPMVRWLSVWLDEFDGPAADHLADFVLEGSDHPAWQGYDDQYGQVVAWTQSEPVVMGVTLVGGIHLGPERLRAVLDRIVVTPGLA